MRTLTCLVLSLFSLPVLASPAPPIIGGSKAKPGEWPDVVAVLGSKGACSGTLIAPDLVLTAGHCIEIEPELVIANTVDYADATAGDRIRVKSARAYPNWEHSYDVGILVLDHVARETPRAIATACAANDLLGARKPVEVIGFGLTSPSGTGDNTVLHAASLPVLDPTCASDVACEPAVRPNGEFTAGGRGTDSCFGDSGGPAMIATRSGPALAGVVSRGFGLPGIPCGNGGVYVRADKVTAWIESVTGRKLARAACDGHGDDPETSAVESDPADGGGCSAGGGTELALGVALCAGVWRRRRRQSRQ